MKLLEEVNKKFNDLWKERSKLIDDVNSLIQTHIEKDLYLDKNCDYITFRDNRINYLGGQIEILEWVVKKL